MKRDVIQCPRCGKALTPEQVEVGQSLVCPRCAGQPRRSLGKERKPPAKVRTGS